MPHDTRKGIEEIVNGDWNIYNGQPKETVEALRQSIHQELQKARQQLLDAVCELITEYQGEYNDPSYGGSEQAYDHGAWQALEYAKTAIKNLLDVNK